MPSTRKQKAMEKRSRQSDMMSDMENLDVMLGSYSRNEIGSQNNGNVEDTDQRSSERQTNTNLLVRTLLNTNRLGNSEITSETARMINSEITSQVSSRLNEFKVDLNLRIRETIEQIISEEVLSTIRQALGEVNNGDQLVKDQTFSERERNPATQPQKKHCDKASKLDRTNFNQDRLDVENSFQTHTDEEDYDTWS